MRTWQRWLIVLLLIGVAMALIVIATIIPQGIIAAVLTAAAAIATIVSPIGSPLVRWLMRKPAPKAPLTNQGKLPITSPASRLHEVAGVFDHFARQYPAGSCVDPSVEGEDRPRLLSGLNDLQRALSMLSDADLNACLDKDSAVAIRMRRSTVRDQVVGIESVLGRGENVDGELRRLVESVEQIRDFIRERVAILGRGRFFVQRVEYSLGIRMERYQLRNVFPSALHQGFGVLVHFCYAKVPLSPFLVAV